MGLSQFNPLPQALQMIAVGKDLEAGEILFTQFEPSESLFCLQSGQIQLAYYTEYGQQINQYSVKPGEIFAETALLSEYYRCSAIATKPSRVLVLPKHAYRGKLRQNLYLNDHLIDHLIRRLHNCELLLALRSIRSAPERLLCYLQLSVKADRRTIVLESPLKEVAFALGLTPESLSRALKKLDETGRISRRKKQITLHQEFWKLDPNQGQISPDPLRLP